MTHKYAHMDFLSVRDLFFIFEVLVGHGRAWTQSDYLGHLSIPTALNLTDKHLPSHLGIINFIARRIAIIILVLV